VSERLNDIVNGFDPYSVDSVTQTLEAVRQTVDLQAEEKIDLTKILSAVFFHAHHTGSSEMPKLALRAGRRIASFGPAVIPVLFDEMIAADSESAAYHGQVLAWIGKESLAYVASRLPDYMDHEHDLINVLQALSYFRIPDTPRVIPSILTTLGHRNHQVIAMALYAVGRLVQKLKPTLFSEDLIQAIFDAVYNLLFNPQVLVRKNAARALGKMFRKHLLAGDRKEKLHKVFLAISGKDEHHNWDRAFIVRREAEEFLPYFQKNSPSNRLYTQRFKILSKRLLCSNTYHFTIEAPLIAHKIEAGQFIIIRPHILSERIPLSICGWNRQEGTIEIIVSAVGKTTTQMNHMEVGECFQDVVGPLGERSLLPDEPGTCLVIGGGYGTGAIIPTAKEIKSMGNRVIGIVGARSEENLIMINELQAVCDDVLLTTNDGSRGIRGIVTDELKNVLQREHVVYVLAVGPVPMMKAVSEMTRDQKINTYVSLNAIMVDGTGMCGACRVTVGGETKFACFHGPDFDGHKVDFDNLMKRQKMFAKQERFAFVNMPN